MLIETRPAQKPESRTGPVEIPDSRTGPVEIPDSRTGPVGIPGSRTGPIAINATQDKPNQSTGATQETPNVKDLKRNGLAQSPACRNRRIWKLPDKREATRQGRDGAVQTVYEIQSQPQAKEVRAKINVLL